MLVTFCIVTLPGGHGAIPTGLLLLWSLAGIPRINLSWDWVAIICAWAGCCFLATSMFVRPRSIFAVCSLLGSACFAVSWFCFYAASDYRDMMLSSSVPFFVACASWVVLYVIQYRNSVA